MVLKVREGGSSPRLELTHQFEDGFGDLLRVGEQTEVVAGQLDHRPAKAPGRVARLSILLAEPEIGARRIRPSGHLGKELFEERKRQPRATPDETSSDHWIG
jgi:hypothetical protein